MEVENTVPRSNSHQNVRKSNQNLGLKQKGYFPILGVIVFMFIVTAGAYYLGTKNSQTIIYQQIGTTNTPSYPTQVVSPATSSVLDQSWIVKTIQIKKETPISGKETIELSMQIPSDWTMQTFNQPSSPEDMIKNCANYVVVSADKITTLTISPICKGWVATSKTWPNNTIIVRDQGKVGEVHFSAAIVRYPGVHDNTFIYAEGYKDQNRVGDAAAFYYGNNFNFIPTNISVNATNNMPNTNITDQIVSSINAQQVVSN